MPIAGDNDIQTFRSGTEQNGLQTDSSDWLLVVEKPIAYLIGCITLLWTIERVSGSSL
jgi:hypothetical protein